MISSVPIQVVFSGLADAAVASSWIQHLGQMRTLEGFYASGQSRFEYAPREDVVRAPPVLRERPAMRIHGDESNLLDPFSLTITTPPDQVFQGLLEALNYVTDRTDIEHAITSAQGRYHVYSGDEDRIQYPMIETLILHTHGNGIALPSFRDLVDIWTNYERDPSYFTFIFSRPPQSYELSYLKPVAMDQLSIWHWQDRFDAINNKHIVMARSFQLLLEMRGDSAPGLLVRELSPFGEMIAQHRYTEENCASIGDEQAFWQLVLSNNE